MLQYLHLYYNALLVIALKLFNVIISSFLSFFFSKCLRIHININVIGKIDIISDQRNKYGSLQERLHDLCEKYSSDDLSDSHFLMV